MQLAAASLPLLPLLLLLIQTTTIVAHKSTCKMSNLTVPIYSESNPTNVIRHDTLLPYNIPPSSANLTKPHLADNGTITLYAPPKTDLWRKPPSLNVSTAPTLYTRVPLRKFHSARVTVRSNWNTLYDQGGLALFLGPPPGEKGSTAGKWVKVGIEWVFGVPNVGTVAADIWADWSLASVPGVNVDGHQYKHGEHTNVTIEIEREVVEVEVEGKKEKKKEASLWVYKVDLDGKTRHGVREVTWVFEEDTGDKEGKGNTELWVGIYAARPTVPEREGVSTAELEREELGVAFENFQIRLFE